MTKTLSSLFLLMFFVSTSQAALLERLGGLAYYDDSTNLTWLTDANAAGTEMGWDDANTWASNLVVGGISGWRLPTTVQPDPACDNQSGTGFSSGFYCTGSEMGNLFYNILGGMAFTPIDNTHNSNYYSFENIQGAYWSSTEFGDSAWVFLFNEGGIISGAQATSTKDTLNFAWAVYDGDVSAVPIPAAVWMFTVGLISLFGFARKNAHL